jgi:hypothetical protein
MFSTMKYINITYPNHSYNSCNDTNRENSGYNLCPRCTLLELRSLELYRLGLLQNTIDEEEN